MSTDEEILEKRLNDIVQIRKTLLPKVWKNENTLMMSRWFDYRFMSPLKLTILFGKLYTEHLRRHVRRHMDVSLAETVNGTKTGVPSERSKWFTALWLARQRADEFLLPYELYLEFCFDFSSRRQRKWTMLPNQLHPSPKNKDAWLGCFMEFFTERTPYEIRRAGDLPQYKVENNLNLPTQIHFRDMIVAEMNHNSRNIADQIADRVFLKRNLTMEAALEVVPVKYRPEVESRAKCNYESDVWDEKPVIKLSKAEMLPSCFGISEAMSPFSSPCSDCPLANECLQFGVKANTTTERLTGSHSPAWIKEKARLAKNTFNCRKRKAEASEPEDISALAA